MKAVPQRTEQSVSATTADMTNPTLGFRMFRPALPANVHVRENRPKNVLHSRHARRSDRRFGPVAHFRRLVARRYVAPATNGISKFDLSISASRREKNPALCPQHGLYRFYFDSICQEWFVRGIYD